MEALSTPEVAEPRELDSRVADGRFKIALWYQPESVPPLLWVTVEDIESDVTNAPISVDDPEQANHIFNHAMSRLQEAS